MTQKIIYPEKPHVPKVNMESCIVFGREKCGKSTFLSELENALFIDTEYGTNHLSVKAIQPPLDKGPVGKMQWLKSLGQQLIDDGRPFDYVIVDTLSEVNEWSEWSGTYKYMCSAQGKSFNREKDKNGNPIKDGPMLTPDHPDYQSVHSIPEGYGYRWSRDEMIDIFNLYLKVAKKCVIFVCHVEDKFIAQKEQTDLVAPKQLALTGKVREIFPRKVDAIGYIYNDKGVLKINFTGSEERVGGTRAKHLVGYNDVADWSKIFI